MTKATCTQCDRKVQAQGLCPTHYSLKWRADNAERYTHHCSHCGVEFKTWRRIMATCSLLCQRRLAFEAARDVAQTILTAARIERTTPVLYRSKPAPPTPTTIVRGGFFVMGWCTECGSPFISRDTVMACSRECQQQRVRARTSDGHHRRRARLRRAYVAPVSRARIYKRDNYICQLCLNPVDMSAVVPHPMAPTIDHIIPLCTRWHTRAPQHPTRMLPLQLPERSKTTQSQRTLLTPLAILPPTRHGTRAA